MNCNGSSHAETRRTTEELTRSECKTEARHSVFGRDKSRAKDHREGLVNFGLLIPTQAVLIIPVEAAMEHSSSPPAPRPPREIVVVVSVRLRFLRSLG